MESFKAWLRNDNGRRIPVTDLIVIMNDLNQNVISLKVSNIVPVTLSLVASVSPEI